MENKAKAFRNLHEGFFLLPNAWDGGSAVTFEKLGYKAIATTSAGMSYAMGLPDGESITFDDLLYRVREMVRVITLPLTVDVERGFSEDIEKVKENVKQVIKAGAVGINIEDGQPKHQCVDAIEVFCQKIAKITSIKTELGVDFMINARLDSFLMNTGSKEQMLEEVISRAKAVKEAGADLIFVPGPLDHEQILSLRQAIDIPINLYLHPACHDVDYFKAIGINRLSSGSAMVRKSLKTTINTARSFLHESMDEVLADSINYHDANKWFKE